MCLEAEVASQVRSFSRVCHLRVTACVKALQFSSLCLARTLLQANSPVSWEVQLGSASPGVLPSPHTAFLTNLTVTKAGKGSSACSRSQPVLMGDAHKQHQTPFNQGKLCNRSRSFSSCSVSTLPRISAILVLLTLSMLHLPDCAGCLLNTAEARRLQG